MCVLYLLSPGVRQEKIVVEYESSKMVRSWIWKDSLVFDLMELFRQKIIDRLILKTLNRGQMWPNDFKMNDEEGCRLTEERRNKWINIFENEMETVYSEFGVLINSLSPSSRILTVPAALSNPRHSTALKD